MNLKGLLLAGGLLLALSGAALAQETVVVSRYVYPTSRVVVNQFPIMTPGAYVSYAYPATSVTATSYYSYYPTLTSYIAPTVTYYPSTAYTTAYYPGTVASTAFYPSAVATPVYTGYTVPAVVTAPSVVVRPKVYVPGQPVRNVLRAITP